MLPEEVKSRCILLGKRLQVPGEAFSFVCFVFLCCFLVFSLILYFYAACLLQCPENPVIMNSLMQSFSSFAAFSLVLHLQGDYLFKLTVGSVIADGMFNRIAIAKTTFSLYTCLQTVYTAIDLKTFIALCLSDVTFHQIQQPCIFGISVL